MCPKKFHTKILDVRVAEIDRMIDLAAGQLVGERSLRTEWFFPSADQVRGQEEARPDLDHWISLLMDEPKIGVLSAAVVESDRLGGQREVRVGVSQVDNMLRVLSHLGHEPRTRLDWYSTTYRLGRAVLSVDEMPGGFSWLSISGPDAGSVLEVVSVLGYENDAHRPFSVAGAYRHQGFDLFAHDEVTFATPPVVRS